MINLGDYISNAIGYLIGIISGYFLNRRFTFKVNKKIPLNEVIKYINSFFIAYSFNIIFIYILRKFFIKDSLIIHIPSSMFYSVVFYILLSRYAFRSKS